MMSSCELVKLDKSHINLVLTWRNLEEVRRNMYSSHEISSDEHQVWFEKTLKDPSKQYFIFKMDGELCGVIGFVDVNMKTRSASWAFYSGNIVTRGIGSQMEIAALSYAFDKLKLQKLSCEVLEFNKPVIKFHRKHGFKVEGIFKKHFLKDGHYWDVFRLAIFAKDWERCKAEVMNRAKGYFSPGKSFTYPFVISDAFISSFAAVTGDMNKIHLDDDVAIHNGFSGKVAHGAISGAIFSKIFGTEFPGEGTVYLSQSVEFTQPIYPNIKLLAKVKVLSKVGRLITVSTQISSHCEELVYVAGEASLLLPLTQIGEENNG